MKAGKFFGANESSSSEESSGDDSDKDQKKTQAKPKGRV